MIFVDTNYFLRFLIKDNESQYKEVKKLFERGIKGEIKLFTSVIVFFELYWVLSSFYGKNKKEISSILSDLLSLVFIDYENREILEEAISLFGKSTLDLEDCYNISYSKFHKAESFSTFDRKLKKYL